MTTTDKHTRVLIIEGAKASKESLASILSGLAGNDFSIETASTAKEIRQKIRQGDPGVIVAALSPHDKRTGVLSELLQKSSPLPIITVTERIFASHDYPFAVRECLIQAEADAYILSKAIVSAVENGATQRDFGNALKEFQTSGIRYLNVILSNADGIVIVNVAGKILFVNPSAREMLGDLLDAERNKFPYAAPVGEFAEISVLSGTGQKKTLEMRSVETVWEGQEARLFSLRNITSRKKAEEMLRLSEERYSLAVRGSKDGLWDWDLVNDRIYFHPQWKEMLGLGEKEVTDTPREWFSRIHKSDVQRVKKAIERHLSGVTKFFNCEFRMLHKDGSYLWVHARGTAILDEKGKPVRIAGSQTDTTQRKKAERNLKNALEDMRFALASEKNLMVELDRKNKELVELSITDGLTRLYNHRFLQERFEFEYKRMRRYGGALSIMIIDIDHFKNVNDTYGHQFGDFVLRELGFLFKSKSREVDICGRYGGEEFMIITHLPTDEIMKFAAKLHAAVEDHVFAFMGHTVRITVSIGIAEYHTDIKTKQEMIERADSALYQAKKDGRNLIRLWKNLEQQDERTVNRSGIEELKKQFADLSSQMRSAYMQSTEALINAVDAKDPFAKEHSHNVSRMAVLIAGQLNLPATEIEVIKYAGLLHNIGKIGIQREILTKTGRLTEQEFEVLKRHPVVGATILKDVKFLEKEIPIILHHHERYDGTGYPYGLKQREIPLGARILAVADAFDAMTAGRSYKKELEREKAVEEIKNKSGTQFSPEIVEAFLQLVELKKV